MALNPSNSSNLEQLVLRVKDNSTQTSVRFKAVVVLAVGSTNLLICQVVCYHNANKL